MLTTAKITYTDKGKGWGTAVAQWLTFWRRNYFFLILAHAVYKM